MQATTIKLEYPILSSLMRFIPKEKSLSAFVREILEQEIQRRTMARAAERYVEFLESSPEEREWLKEWESADLEQPPKLARKGKHR